MTIPDEDVLALEQTLDQIESHQRELGTLIADVRRLLAPLLTKTASKTPGLRSRFAQVSSGFDK